jgi:hypothetical protein
MARGRGAPKKKPVQQSLQQAGQLPLLKKPADTVGKAMKVIGSHWGSSCPPADKNKLFVVVIKEFTYLHSFSPTERGPGVQLLEMGVDGHGGQTDPFWMRYPYPFLTFWYEAHPLQPEDASTPPPGSAGSEPPAPEVVEEKPKSIVYDYLEPVRSERKNGRQVNVFSCKAMVTLRGEGGSISKACGGSVTLFGKSTGPFFKHVRRHAKHGCEAHQALLETINLSSCRQVRGCSARAMRALDRIAMLLSMLLSTCC